MARAGGAWCASQWGHKKFDTTERVNSKITKKRQNLDLERIIVEIKDVVRGQGGGGRIDWEFELFNANNYI